MLSGASTGEGKALYEVAINVLAVDEACANSIIHGHEIDGKSEFDLYIQREKDLLVIEIRDKGTPFPIDKYQPEQIETLIKNKTQGGLGILLITSIMDKVEVLRKEEQFTCRFTKKLGS